MPGSQQLEIIPLGGLGEFGMNLMVYRHGTDCVVVDAGMMFPGEEHLGVDVVVPDMSFLGECGTLHGVVLTHGHEDHIGALPYLLARHDVPVYSSRYTEGLIRRRLDEHRLRERPGLHRLPGGDDSIEIGPFRIQTVPVAHSIPESSMVVLHTPLGVVLHTADFKLDPDPPDGVGTDLARLEELGRNGILALLSDSTNAERQGFTPGERTVVTAIDGLLATAQRRVLVTCFSSNVQRIQTLADLAVRHGRRLALVGTSLQSQADVAEQLGLLRLPPGLRAGADEVMDLPPEQALIAVTGSQGEPLSALARIAVDRHRDVAIEPGDLVIHSARVIPGNEKSISRMINHLLRRGAEVITSATAPVHVSGHPSQEELRRLLQLARPRHLIPIHGEYRHLHAHARLAVDSGMASSCVQLAESGDIVVLEPDRVSVEGRVHVGQVFIDASLDRVDWSHILDRRRSSADGIVVAVVAVDRDGGAEGGSVEIVTRGFVPDNQDGQLMRDLKRIVVAALTDATPEERTDEAALRARLHSDLKRFLRKRTQRQPLIIPVIVEM